MSNIARTGAKGAGQRLRDMVYVNDVITIPICASVAAKPLQLISRTLKSTADCASPVILPDNLTNLTSTIPPNSYFQLCWE